MAIASRGSPKYHEIEAAEAEADRELAYVDLHFHLLPGVDDGPDDMDASLELARAAVTEGTGTVVVTPHVRSDLGITDAVEIHARVMELRFALEAAQIPLQIRCGGELGHEMVSRMRRSELELIAEGVIAVVASDAHGPSRPPALALARRTMLEVGITRRAAESLIESTPHRLLATGIASPSAVAA